MRIYHIIAGARVVASSIRRSSTLKNMPSSSSLTSAVGLFNFSLATAHGIYSEQTPVPPTLLRRWPYRYLFEIWRCARVLCCCARSRLRVSQPWFRSSDGTNAVCYDRLARKIPNNQHRSSAKQLPLPPRLQGCSYNQLLSDAAAGITKSAHLCRTVAALGMLAECFPSAPFTEHQGRPACGLIIAAAGSVVVSEYRLLRKAVDAGAGGVGGGGGV